MADKSLEIWNEAYSIYTDSNRTEGAQYNDMQSYLRDQVKAGNIDMATKFAMAADIMRTADL